MEPKVGMFVKKFNSSKAETMQDGEVSCIESVEGQSLRLENQKGYGKSEFRLDGKLRLCDQSGVMLPMPPEATPVLNEWTLHEPVGNYMKAPFRRAPIWISKDYNPSAAGTTSNITLKESEARTFTTKDDAEEFREKHQLRPSWTAKQVGKPIAQGDVALFTSAPNTERIPCDHEKEIVKLKERYDLVVAQNTRFETDIGLEHQERIRLEALCKEAWAELGRFGMMSDKMRREREAIVKTSRK